MFTYWYHLHPTQLLICQTPSTLEKAYKAIHIAPFQDQANWKPAVPTWDPIPQEIESCHLEMMPWAPASKDSATFKVGQHLTFPLKDMVAPS